MKTNRPYFLAELADLTIAPDIYNCDDDDHNLMEYEVSLGTQQLLTAELLKRGRVTLATTHPIAIPRWFAPGHARTEAAEHAVITRAQQLRTAQRDHIDHPLWVTTTSPPAPPPPTAPPSAQPPSPPPDNHLTPRSPQHTPPTPAPARSRLPCFLAITGPQHSGHAMLTRTRASPQPPTAPQSPRRQRLPPQDNTTPAVASPTTSM